MPEFWIKSGDSLPVIQGTCIGADGSAVALTNVGTVLFNMMNKHTGSVVISGGTGSVVDAATGVVKYGWGTADTANPGEYLGEFPVNFPHGTWQTFPNGGTAKYIDIHIPGQIA